MEPTVLRRGLFYSLGDLFPGVPLPEQRFLRGKWDGKPKRPPKKGEWYLSGSIIMAWRAPTDFSENMSYRIAEIHKVEGKTTMYSVRNLTQEPPKVEI